MRAGRLKTRRYKVRRRGLGWLLLAVGIALGAAARPLMNGEWRSLLPSQLLPARPVSTPAPQDSQAAERTFTLAGSTWYALELGAFDSAEEAQALASSFRGRGAGGYAAWQDNAWRVLAAAYATRHAAKNLVAAGLAKKCEIGVAYAIGVAKPVSLTVDTFGTGVLPDDRLAEIVAATFDLRPAAIIDRLDLRRPIYAQTAAYGHFGRTDVDLPWEHLDYVDALKEASKNA